MHTKRYLLYKDVQHSGRKVELHFKYILSNICIVNVGLFGKVFEVSGHLSDRT